MLCRLSLPQTFGGVLQFRIRQNKNITYIHSSTQMVLVTAMLVHFKSAWLHQTWQSLFPIRRGRSTTHDPWSRPSFIFITGDVGLSRKHEKWMWETCVPPHCATSKLLIKHPLTLRIVRLPFFTHSESQIHLGSVMVYREQTGIF